MLSADEISTSLRGAWRLMFGQAEGLRLLDLSADGFWNSFFAIVVALPAMVVGWVGLANELAGPDALAARFGLLVRLAAVDIGTWILPLIVLALVARPAGISGRFVPYVVASNWASAIIAWMMVPAALARLVLPAAEEFVGVVSLVLFVLSLVFSWRMTNAAIARGAAVATAVFVSMFAVSLGVLFWLQAMLGVAVP
jgi:hypothetical protein